MPGARPRRVQSGLDVALDVAGLTAVFLLLAATSWRRWADVYVDFGQQLYMAWRLSEGAVLYRDLAYLHGPLSPYVNSLAFRLFGASYTALFSLNLVLALLVAVVLHGTFRAAFGRCAGWVASALYVVVFAFGQYVGTGNYNWISPYDHGATHGVALFAALVVVLAGSAADRLRWFLAGTLVGLLLLTRSEIAVAAAVALCLLGVVTHGRQPARAGRPLLWGTLGTLLTAAAAMALFATALPARDAARAAAGAWAPLLAGVASTPFFLAGAGLDDPGLALQVTLVSALSDGLLVGGVVWVSWLWRRTDTHRALLVTASALALAAVTVAAATAYPGAVGRSLPVLSLLPVLFWSADLRRARSRTPGGAGEPNDDPTGGRFDEARRVGPLLWSVFGLALLAKMGLNARIDHYGFYLALPAAVTLAVFLVADLPARVSARGGNGVLLRAGMVVLVGLLAARLALESHGYHATRSLAVGRDGDRMLTPPPDRDPRAGPFLEALAFLEGLPADATVQVLPEGVMLNYLARRVAPSIHTNYMVTEVTAFGEEAMLEDLSRAPPDYIVLMHKDTSEFGYAFFGVDDRYGRRILEWVRAGYHRVLLLGAEPLRSPAFGIEILARDTARDPRPPDGPAEGG